MDVHEGLARTYEVLGDPMSGGYFEPAWWGYSSSGRVNLLRRAVEALVEDDEFTEDELKSLDELHTSLREQQRRECRRLARDRDAMTWFTTEERREIYVVSQRLQQALVSRERA